jgi:hypothetical protein
VSTILRDTEDTEQLSMIGCGTIEVSTQGRRWECVLPFCDGEHHYMTLNSWEYHSWQ